MRKLLILCAVTVPLCSFAEPTQMNKEVVCDDATTLITHFISKENEQLIFVGNATQSNLIVLVNAVTMGWTVIQANDTKACVIEVGQGFKYREPAIKPDPEKLVSN